MFMTWRTPRGAKAVGDEITNEQLDRAIREQFQSTYGKRLFFLQKNVSLKMKFLIKFYGRFRGWAKVIL